MLFVYQRMTSIARGETLMQIRSLNIGFGSQSSAAFPFSEASRGLANLGLRGLALVYFASLVQQNGEWDAKVWIRNQFGPFESTYNDPLVRGDSQQVYYYDIWGNIAYGYLGSAAGFDDETLLEGAGLAQYLGKFRDAWTIGIVPTTEQDIAGWRKWDPFRDQASIEVGIYLWTEFQLSLDATQLYETIINSPIPIGPLGN
jgi:hypothetical protein